MKLINLGLASYTTGMQLQEQAVQELATGGKERLILLEHPPSITFGKNGGEENLPFSVDFFNRNGVQVIKSVRGGNITCHFPGQLVAYPIMKIDRRKGGLKAFFYDMEETVILTLKKYGLAGKRIENKAGVWIHNRKICSTGIAVKKWITSHGLSFNVSRDLSLFEIVSPCGMQDIAATSLHRELDSSSPSMAEVKRHFLQAFSHVFSVNLEH